MIIWLASYPRSGNSLIQSILRDCMGLRITHFAQHLKKEERPESANEGNSHEAWTKFYARASQDDEIHLVKTHHLPLDESPAILILRDGRKCCWSYLDLKRRIKNNYDVSLMDLVLGADGHGDWTTMVRSWRGQKKGALFEARYEDCIHATPEKVQELADFIGYKGAVKPWMNSFVERKKTDPIFYREGVVSWNRPEGWSDTTDWAFRLIHGPLMVELGYMTEQEAEAGNPPLLSADEVTKLMRLATAQSSAAWRRGFEARNLRRQLKKLTACASR
jgi:hypothetical protein